MKTMKTTTHIHHQTAHGIIRHTTYAPARCNRQSTTTQRQTAMDGTTTAMLNHNRLNGTEMGVHWVRPYGGHSGQNGLMNAYMVTPRGARAALAALLPFQSDGNRSKDVLMKRHYGKDVNAYFLRCCLALQNQKVPSTRTKQRRFHSAKGPFSMHPGPGSDCRGRPLCTGCA